MKKLDQQGQTAVEYLLMLGVVTVIMISILGKVRERMIGDGPDSLYGQLQIVLDQTFGTNGEPSQRYRYYNLRGLSE